MRRVLTCLSIVLTMATAAFAEQGSGQADGQKPTTWQPTPTRTVELFPAGDIYQAYAADPHRSTSQIAIGFYSTIEIPESSSPRTSLTAGGRFGMLRIDSSSPTGRSWQLSLDAAFDAVFDSQYKNDGIGWDGNYGIMVTTTGKSSPFAFKFAVLHTSAHLGDEYEERTGTSRINYTREEVALGASWRPRARTRIYGELGMAYLMRSEGQQPLRWQMGGEYERPTTVLGGRMAWYGAVDLSLYEEREWRLDTSLQGGLVTRNHGRTFRIFAQWYDGRSTLGQFTAYSEAALSLGFTVDL
jgi:hypothetical protein